MGSKGARDDDRAFAFVPASDPPPKPRTRGLTEIRGPYYTPVGEHYLQDLLQTMAGAIDSLKFAGGSFRVMPRKVVRALIDVCHAQVTVSTCSSITAKSSSSSVSARGSGGTKSAWGRILTYKD
jgi:phosphosulfolactate synthase (CoM biosynthesis protein A)